MLSEQEQAIVRLLQGDIPLVPEPFTHLAQELAISETDLLKEISDFQDQGIIRRFGAMLAHRKAGLTANAMIVWQVPVEQVEDVGKRFAKVPAVTHCYERPRKSDWPYNLFTMVHGETENDCQKIAQELAQLAGISDYQLLFSLEEYKKTSMEYYR